MRSIGEVGKSVISVISAGNGSLLAKESAVFTGFTLFKTVKFGIPRPYDLKKVNFRRSVRNVAFP